MTYNEFKSINDSVRSNDFNGVISNGKVLDYTMINDMCLLEDANTISWISVSLLVQNIISKKFYISNPSKLKKWVGFVS